MEQTFIMVKPDGVQRGLVGQIITRFEQKGYWLRAIKMVWPTEDLLNKHYADHVNKGFYPSLQKYMLSGTVCAMVWEGKSSVVAGRKLLGATNPVNSEPGTIRGDYCIDMGRNLIHGSDSVEAAKTEIGLWFKEEEINKWQSHSNEWLYE